MVEFYSSDISLSLSLSLFENEIKINMNGKLSPQFLTKKMEGEANKETKAALFWNLGVNEKHWLKTADIWLKEGQN